MFQQPLSPALRPIFWLAVYLLPTFTIREPLIEHDTYWHLHTGEWILEHHQIPTTDPFTTVGGDQPWIAYSWLFSVFFERLYSVSGLWGILVWRVLMSVAIVAATHGMVARRQSSMLCQILIVAGSAIALTSMFLAERPGLVTILFAIATLEAILRILDRQPLVGFWFLPIVYALWANVHIQFVHGLFLFAIAGAAFVIQMALKPGGDLRPLGRLIVLGGLCGLATLVNPYGLHIYDVVLNYGGNREIYAIFEELKPLAFRSPADWVILGLFSAAVFALGRRTDATVAEALLLAACAAFSFHAKHELWMVVIVSAAILSRWRISNAAVDSPLTWSETAIIAAGIALMLVARLALGNAALEENQKTATRAEYPVAAVDWWQSLPKDEKPHGPIFVEIAWGGYVSWRLPEETVTIDGRAQLHGGARVRRFHDVGLGRPGWQNDPDLLSAGAIIIPRSSALAELLRASPDYRVRHEDDVAIVLTRN